MESGNESLVSATETCTGSSGSSRGNETAAEIRTDNDVSFLASTYTPRAAGTRGRGNEIGF